MSCRLIINADDFGHSEGVNRAVIAGHESGIITSCSLMVAEDAAPEAMAWAQRHAELPVGLHVTLLRGRPALPPEAVPALVDRDGRFGSDPFRVGMRYALSPAARLQIRAEVAEQFRLFALGGIPMSHVDSHLHFHLHPAVLSAILAQAVVTGCRAVRVPRDSWRMHAGLDFRDALSQVGLAGVFAVLCAVMRARLRRAGIRSAARCYGLFQTGLLTPRYVAGLIRRLPEGDHELHCHPDYDTAAGRAELAALLSDEVRDAIRDRGARLISYRDLVAA